MKIQKNDGTPVDVHQPGKEIDNQIRLNDWLSMTGKQSYKKWIFWVTLDFWTPPIGPKINENLEKMKKKTPIEGSQKNL